MYDLEVYSEDFLINIIEIQKWLANFWVEKIIDFFEPKKILDVGCGAGGHVEVLRENGVEAYGIEGSPNVWEVTKFKPSDNIIIQHDLREKLDKPPIQDIDMVESFEVAEHIEEKYVDVFMDNMVISDQTYTLWSNAQPGQAGTMHENLKPKEYWIDKMDDRGYECRVDLLNEIKSWGRPNPSPQWFPENLMVFSKRDRFERTVTTRKLDGFNKEQ